MIKYSDSKEIPNVYFDMHQVVDNDVEERLRRLKIAVDLVFNKRIHKSSKNKKIAPPPGFEPGTIGLTGRRSTS